MCLDWYRCTLEEEKELRKMKHYSCLDLEIWEEKVKKKEEEHEWRKEERVK